MTSADAPTLYERIGGSDAIAAAIDAFYERVLADDRVSGYFDDIDMDRLKGRQREFFVFGTGGPATYDVERIERMHARHGIDADAYEIFMGHFEDTLLDFGVPVREREELLAAVHGFRDAVITE